MQSADIELSAYATYGFFMCFAYVELDNVPVVSKIGS